MAPEESKGKSIEELMAEVSRELEGTTGAGQDMGGSKTASRGDIPPWEDDISDAPAADLFPSLTGESGPDGAHTPLHPPTLDRDKDGYDRNNWSRLLRQARDMRPEIAEYLEVLRQTGIGLELKKYKKKGSDGKSIKDSQGKVVVIEKFNFTPGENKNWDDRRIKEVMSALYTYMTYLPARKELGQDNVVVQTLEKAISAGGLLAVNEGGLRFDWSGAVGKWGGGEEGERKAREEVNQARGLMDQCGAEIMQYIKLAERRLRDIGFVVSLAEMSDCVEGF